MIENIKQEQPTLSHNKIANRFEIGQDGHLAVLEYEIRDARIIFTHTGVPKALGGQGLGSRLVKAGLEYARKEGLKVVPLCSFVAGYIQKHPGYADLVE